jgi:hypothetical protein
MKQSMMRYHAASASWRLTSEFRSSRSSGDDLRACRNEIPGPSATATLAVRCVEIFGVFSTGLGAFWSARHLELDFFPAGRFWGSFSVGFGPPRALRRLGWPWRVASRGDRASASCASGRSVAIPPSFSVSRVSEIPGCRGKLGMVTAFPIF